MRCRKVRAPILTGTYKETIDQPVKRTFFREERGSLHFSVLHIAAFDNRIKAKGSTRIMYVQRIVFPHSV